MTHLVDGFFFLTVVDLKLILEGLKVTLLISCLTLIFSFPLGLFLGILMVSRYRFFRFVVTLYIELVRSMPLTLYIVLVFLIFPFSPDVRGVFTLSTFTAAYIAQIAYAGLSSLNKHEIRAARALGLRPHQVLFKVALPQAIVRMLPAFINQYNVVIKDTSLVSIGLLELTSVGKILSERRPVYAMEVILLIALIYFAICYALALWGGFIEKKVGQRFKKA